MNTRYTQLECLIEFSNWRLVILVNSPRYTEHTAREQDRDVDLF